MKTAMFGGSFNPIHNGHVALVRHFADLLELDRVFVVPAGIPPNKRYGTRLDGDRRLEMCRLALQDDPRLEACDIELRREGVSYTIYTVMEIIAMGAEGRVALITGADTFLTLEGWHRFSELKDMVTFCTVPREGVSKERLLEHAQHLESLGCSTLVTEMPQVRISSTQIRTRAALGLSLRGLVPPAVEEYILRSGLYRELQ